MKSKIDFHLIFITDSSLNSNLYKIVKQAAAEGVKAVQLREKKLTAKELLGVARKLRTLTKKSGTKILINDRYDIALLSNANGLHSPENGILPAHIKKRKILMGKSVHSLNSSLEAEKSGFDYVIFGPVFRTPSKIKYGPPKGLNQLKKVCSMVSLPVFAVGGINPVRARKCIQNGAYGVAVIRELMLSKNISKTVSDFNEQIRKL